MFHASVSIAVLHAGVGSGIRERTEPHKYGEGMCRSENRKSGYFLAYV